VVHNVKCLVSLMEQPCVYCEEQVKFWTVLFLERNRFRDKHAS